MELKQAYIGLGSNLGDRKGNIQRALRAMEERGIAVTNTSMLYESAPMYVTDQPVFLNACCSVLTHHGPFDLLRVLQSIEVGDLKRVKLVDKGPRTIDLDILLYNQPVISTPELTVPHRGIEEREFVYVPLSDITDLDEHGISIDREKIVHHSLALHQPFLAKARTTMMAILNLTPDSFSDGNVNSLDTLDRYMQEGVDIIDIGGQSTRPTATLISAEEEASRVIPAIKQLRLLGWKHEISIDTFYASVARQAIQAGASMINDVSGGTMDPDMYPTAAQLGVPICLMHMRGTPQTMNTPQNLQYPDGVVRGMMEELAIRYRDAVVAGIRTWNIILDPGLSFSKDLEQNLEILRTPLGGKIPWLVGPSRKGFIGKITGVEKADERQLGTAVAVTAAIQQGASIVRVHDLDMRQVLKMADAIYRP